MTILHMERQEAQAIAQHEGLLLVDFTAPWCPPCKALNPIMDQLNEEVRAGGVEIRKLNVDDHPETATAYGVQSMPTIIIFRNGEPMERIVGFRPIDVYRQLIAKYQA